MGLQDNEAPQHSIGGIGRKPAFRHPMLEIDAVARRDAEEISRPPDHIFFKLNPMYHLIAGYRESFMGGLWFWNHPLRFAGFWISTVLLNVWSWKLFGKLSDQFADVI